MIHLQCQKRPDLVPAHKFIYNSKIKLNLSKTKKSTKFPAFLPFKWPQNHFNFPTSYQLTMPKTSELPFNISTKTAFQYLPHFRLQILSPLLNSRLSQFDLVCRFNGQSRSAEEKRSLAVYDCAAFSLWQGLSLRVPL